MAVVVIGGHTRNIGKTSVVAGIIRALPELHWTAFKVTQYGHGICSANGEPCDCETDDHTVAVTEEKSATSGTDSARYLAAGAVKSWWVRTRVGNLAEAMPRVRKEIAAAENAILESNSVLRFLRPDLFLSMLDPSVEDFKESALRYLDRADAVLVPAGGLQDVAWKKVSLKLIERVPRFEVSSPTYVSEDVIDFVRKKLTGT
jgi:hypothetical protein